MYSIRQIAKLTDSSVATTSRYVPTMPEIFTPQVTGSKVTYEVNQDYSWNKLKKIFDQKKIKNIKNKKTRWADRTQ